jgi:glycosyltransferase involved in cell wall biosynthesis
MEEITNTDLARRFVFISTCPDAWGGSEELWSQAAAILAERGHRISAFKTTVDEAHPRIRRLKSLSCKVRDLERIRLPQRLSHLLLPRRYQMTGSRKHLVFLGCYLAARRPRLVVISQGDNYDALHFGYLCRKLKLPYTLISQKASDFFWPVDNSRPLRRNIFGDAAKCFFVSQHNLTLTEEQIGARLPNAEVVRNPFLVAADCTHAWPGDEAREWRLACVARLYVVDKGQDILLRVLAREKWKNRNLRVTFFGEGINREGLEGLAARLEVNNVTFAGQTSDVSGIWRDHHALIMPSRNEGLPLSLVEAMMCGRTAIVTDVGGNAEVIEDGVTGFLAPAAAETDVDDALERAWQRRGEWQAMGERAAKRIRELVPADPAAAFADKLVEIASALKVSKRGRLVERRTHDREQMENQARVAGLRARD